MEEAGLKKFSIDEIMSLGEAARRWNLGESTLRNAIARKRFISDHEVRKSHKVWLITKTGMERLYGPEPKKDNK